MTHVTCRLTAKNRDQLRNATLGNRVWATFTLFIEFKVRVRVRCGGHVCNGDFCGADVQGANVRLRSAIILLRLLDSLCSRCISSSTVSRVSQSSQPKIPSLPCASLMLRLDVVKGVARSLRLQWGSEAYRAFFTVAKKVKTEKNNHQGSNHSRDAVW